MSESQTKALPEAKREPREPRALSNEYHKARKQLMLWAGILFIWELVGIDLEKAKDAEGNVGAIIRSIRSPQAVPWALLILVGYFLFKFTIEWYQCNAHRRSFRVAKVDFVSAWIVALLAYALYIYQAVNRVQFADIIQRSNKWLSIGCGVFSGLLLGAFIVRRWNLRGVKFERFDYIYGLSVLVLQTTTFIGAYLALFTWYLALTAVAGAALVVIALNAIID
jgi:hypothetical protein